VPKIIRILILLALVTSAQLVNAQTELDEREAQEQIKQQAFRDAMIGVVGSLNAGSFNLFTKAIDRNNFIDRIFGLRLIDGGIKRDFRDDMNEPGKWGEFIASLYAEEAEQGIRATLLIVESRGDRGRAVVRFDMSFFRANYHEYDLILDDNGRMRIVDWNDYFWGHKFTDRMGLTLVQAMPNQNAARKLVDFPNVRESQVFQIMEILKATRDRNLDRYKQIVEGMDERLKNQRVVVMLGLDAARSSRKRRAQRTALQRVDELFPEDPLLALALLDLYLPAERYQDAYDSLARLQKHLRVDDALINARISSVLLVMGKVDEAHELAMKSVTQEPNLELGWWSVFRARVTAEDYVAAIESLEILEDEFGHSLGPDALAKDEMFKSFMLSAEYRVWFEESD
jgi:tetratricopeptide (TPR) repeat protein